MLNFNEWMTFRQAIEEDPSDYKFIGTYNSDKIENLRERSNAIKIDSAIEKIPESYRGQFYGLQNFTAGTSTMESGSNVIWITNNDQDIVYLFEKT